jgi:hypothetical protein
MEIKAPFMFPYKFVATYDDGSQFVQTDDDVSPTNPEKSAFFDVEQNRERLEMFALGGVENPNAFTLHIKTGQFSVNGAVFTIHPNNLKVVPESIEVIYWRIMRQHKHLDMNSDGVVIAERYSSEIVSFHIGWSCVDLAGEYHQFVLEIPAGD